LHQIHPKKTEGTRRFRTGGKKIDGRAHFLMFATTQIM
jgi:hypothetical protein